MGDINEKLFYLNFLVVFRFCKVDIPKFGWMLVKWSFYYIKKH